LCAGPWNQVAVIQPSECQTVAKRYQSPASRHTTQFSTVSRIARFSAVKSFVMVFLLILFPFLDSEDITILELNVFVPWDDLLNSTAERLIYNSFFVPGNKMAYFKDPLNLVEIKGFFSAIASS
jgi:hypothetical protein